MKTIKLSSRLQVIAEFIPRGSSVCDVGTDHGYLPVWLAQHGICEKIIASDIKEGPLDSARRNAVRYGADGDIEFVLADGLAGIEPGSVDTIVIAGMGGENIAAILDESQWAILGGCTLILQPMSKIDLLREYIYEKGYKTSDERLVKDRGDIYTVIKADKGEAEKLSPARLHISERLLESRDPFLEEYLDILITKSRRAAEGIEKAESAGDTGKLSYYKELIKEIEHMKEEILSHDEGC